MGGPDAAPYARIVAEVRRRITVGELSAGDRVPSTRELTREWGVAMATATKALTALRLEGLVRAVPGVGTVVADPAPRPPDHRQEQVHAPARRRAAAEPVLTADLITTAAVAVADAEGMSALSMRRVATELGVATMSLYRHVADKDDLVLRMLDVALGDWDPPHPPPAGWRARFELAGTALWAAFCAHPWLASAMSFTRPQPTASGLVFTEWCLSALEGTGLDLSAKFDAQLILFNFVRGIAVNLETEAAAQEDTGMDNEAWMDTQLPALQAILGSGRFPTMTLMVQGEYDFDLDALFATGLQYLLDGMAGRIEARQSPSRTWLR